MGQLSISKLPTVEESEATGSVAEIFDDIKRDMEIPFVPNIFKAAAGSPHVLAGTWQAMRSVELQTSLPMSLKAMVLYSIAASRKCQYCSAVHQVTCKTIGIEEETLEALVQDLSALAPQRVQEIIKFAVKCANDPMNLSEADYDRVREQGISEEELMEIVGLSALGVYLIILANGMKIEVDSVIQEALKG
jgi:uncharacterized peroxidase-related enzyme